MIFPLYHHHLLTESGNFLSITIKQPKFFFLYTIITYRIENFLINNNQTTKVIFFSTPSSPTHRLENFLINNNQTTTVFFSIYHHHLVADLEFSSL
jgi:hypothetical protein